MNDGFVLVSPKGRIIAITFDESKRGAEGKAYDYLFRRYLWPRSYWKQWDEFCTERGRRKWNVVPAKLSIAKGKA
jgi:hypothetical protein